MAKTAPSSDLGIRKKQSSPLARIKQWYTGNKRYSIPLTILVIVGILLAIPVTRYVILGTVVKSNVVVAVKDSRTQKPVSEAKVVVGGREAVTGADGVATVTDVRVGFHGVTVSKSHYTAYDERVEVAIGSETHRDVQLIATGLQASVTVIDAIEGTPVEGAVVEVGQDNRSTTDAAGVASLILPTDVEEASVTITRDGYTAVKATAKVDNEVEVSLAPSGTIYFLSKRSGTIDVVQTNLDGSSRKTILKGTGNERDNETSLLAARDWKYLLLRAKRDTKDALYIIDTTTGKYTMIDEVANNDTYVELIGWSGHRFLYSLTRDRSNWEAGKIVLKSYDAAAQKLTIIDETVKGLAETYEDAYDDVSQTMHSFYILKDNQVVYVKEWSGEEGRLQNRQTVIASIQADGSNKQTLKAYPASELAYIEAKLYTPQNIHYRVWNNNYERRENVQTVDGKVTLVPPAEQKFDQAYPTFLISPDGSRSFWAESRDGKNALFVGDNDATKESTQQLVTLSDYKAYGWFTDRYVLLQKNNSELYITTTEQLKAGDKGEAPLKISDYHKPDINFAGYGYGYGGQ